jgi:hypothetical protein
MTSIYGCVSSAKPLLRGLSDLRRTYNTEEDEWTVCEGMYLVVTKILERDTPDSTIPRPTTGVVSQALSRRGSTAGE